MTKKLYLQDTYQFHFDAVIQDIGTDEKGTFIVLDQTTFYPQGGGQPADHGTIKTDTWQATINHVVQRADEIKHYLTCQISEIPLGAKGHCMLNQERRLLNARYHTAGHLLGNVVELLHPMLKACKGHSFPGEAYVEFEGNQNQITLKTLQDEINKAIANNEKTIVFEIDPKTFETQFYTLSYPVPENKKFRAMQIGTMPPVPCGGTHLSCLGEIGHMSITKIKNKNETVRISYALE